jgi:hypothetical protein
MSGAIPPLPKYASMAWFSVKAQGQIYLYYYRLDDHGSIPGWGNDGIFSPSTPDRLWGPPNLTSNGYWKAWSYSSTPSILLHDVVLS